MKFSSGACLLAQEFDNDFGHLVANGSYDPTRSPLLSTERSQHNTILDDLSPNLGKCSFPVRADESSNSHEIDWEAISRKLLKTPTISEVNEVFMSNMNRFYGADPAVQQRVQTEFDLLTNDMLGSTYKVPDSEDRGAVATPWIFNDKSSGGKKIFSDAGYGFWDHESTSTRFDSLGGRLYNSMPTEDITQYTRISNWDIAKSTDWAYQTPDHNQWATFPALGYYSTDENNLFVEELMKKRKFRLLINPEVENWIRAEFQKYSCDLASMIEMKWGSLSIPVKISAYIRPDKDKTNDKAFIIVFENYRDVEKGFNLVKSGKLPFPMREARPSPSYHVKYEVLYPMNLFEGKCFIERSGKELHIGDVVTANQLKGNKLRIIKCIRFGSDIEFALDGWVLLRRKDTDFLRGIGQLEVEMPTNAAGRPWDNTGELVESPRKITHKANPQRVSAAKCSPFKVLAELQIFSGRKEPLVVGLLKPGSIVWANQHKGSMLRIVKTDKWGSIKLDRRFKPEVRGWVCLKGRDDDKPRLERISGFHADPIKATARPLEDERNNSLSTGNDATKCSEHRKNHVFNMEDALEAMEFKPKETYHDQANSCSPKNSNFRLPQVQSSATHSLTSPSYMPRNQNSRKLIDVKEQEATMSLGGEFSGHQ